MKATIKYPQAKCAYCGKQFTKHHNRQIYCSQHCRTEARKEKRRTYNLRYYNKHKKRIHQKYTGTNTLAPRMNPDHKREQEIVQNEIRRIGLHTF